jgi:3-oxoacyl-[acyl-carrier protein] reductase
MILKNKNAVIYGAGGSLGGAVAKALAAAGAKIYLTGRNAASLKKIADEIKAGGGIAEQATVDATDEKAVSAFLDAIVLSGNTVDISFNATSSDDVQDMALINMSEEDFMRPVNKMLRTGFLTAKAAGNIMAKQGSGVILSLTATPAGIGYPYTGGFAVACTAVESLVRNLGSELGIYGVRVVNMRSGGSPDSAVFKNAVESYPEIMQSVLADMKADTMLKKMPMMTDIANLAVFLSSDLASCITGVTIDITAGTTAALNYRVKADKSTPTGPQR